MKTVTSILLLRTSLILGAAATSPRVRGMANDFGKVRLDSAELGNTLLFLQANLLEIF